MWSYELTKDAETDLEGIARYTIKHWGEDQAKSYSNKISQCCKNISNNKVVSRIFSERFPDAKVVRCEHHFIFYLVRDSGESVIFAVLHERMDILIKLKDRLG